MNRSTLFLFILALAALGLPAGPAHASQFYQQLQQTLGANSVLLPNFIRHLPRPGGDEEVISAQEATDARQAVPAPPPAAALRPLRPAAGQERDEGAGACGYDKRPIHAHKHRENEDEEERQLQAALALSLLDSVQGKNGRRRLTTDPDDDGGGTCGYTEGRARRTTEQDDDQDDDEDDHAQLQAALALSLAYAPQAASSDQPVPALSQILRRDLAIKLANATVQQVNVPRQGHDGSCGYHAIANALAYTAFPSACDIHALQTTIVLKRRQQHIEHCFGALRTSLLQRANDTPYQQTCAQAITQAITTLITPHLTGELRKKEHALTFSARSIRHLLFTGPCIEKAVRVQEITDPIQVPGTTTFVPRRMEAIISAPRAPLISKTGNLLAWNYLDQCAYQGNIEVPPLTQTALLEWLDEQELKALLDSLAQDTRTPTTYTVITDPTSEAEKLEELRKQLHSNQEGSHVIILGTMAPGSATGHWFSLTINQQKDETTESGVRRDYFITDSQGTLRLYDPRIQKLVELIEGKPHGNLPPILPPQDERIALYHALEAATQTVPTAENVRNANELREFFEQMTGDPSYRESFEAWGRRMPEESSPA